MAERNDGGNALARTIQRRIREISNRDGPVFDCATVRSDLSLITDAYEIVIPNDDYAKLQIECSVNVGDGVYTGEAVPTLASGDRVLVAFMADDVIVLGKLV